MQVSRVVIKNFRNFKFLEVEIGTNIILLGENSVGKTNFFQALRLVLDPDSERRLRKEDFHRGVTPFHGAEIEVQIQFTDYASDPNLLKILSSSTIQDTPPVAQVSYLYRPKINVEPDKAIGREDYEPVIYGGKDKNNQPRDIRHLRLKFIPALRDIESDVSVWRHSPLRRLIDLMNLSTNPDFIGVVNDVSAATQKLQGITAIKGLQNSIKAQLADMVEGGYRLDPRLGMLPSEPDELQRALKLFVDESLSLDRTSLGLTNVLYLTLLLLEIEQREKLTGDDEDNGYQFVILAVEEPESHLHPHLQRLVFRHVLRRHPPILLSTHSPHIVSISDPDSLVLLQDRGVDGTRATSTAGLARLPDWEPDWDAIKRDLARYLDANRGEVVFSKGVVLVEGDAEAFLVPEFARQMKISGKSAYTLDGCGVTVCSVSGTNFTPYVRFLGPAGLGLPIVVLTDGDKYVGLEDRVLEAQEDEHLDAAMKQRINDLYDENDLDTLRSVLESCGYGCFEGLWRGVQLANLIKPGYGIDLQALYSQSEWEVLRTELAKIGIFVNDWTLEAEMISAGYQDDMIAVYGELGASARQQANMKRLIMGGEMQNVEKVIGRIEDKGKGRFAQRLSDKVDAKRVPIYISSALEFIVTQVGAIIQSQRPAPLAITFESESLQ